MKKHKLTFPSGVTEIDAAVRVTRNDGTKAEATMTSDGNVLIEVVGEKTKSGMFISPSVLRMVFHAIMSLDEMFPTLISDAEYENGEFELEVLPIDYHLTQAQENEQG